MRNYMRIIAGLVALLAFGLAGCNSPGVSVSSDGRQVAVSHQGSLYVADIEHENWRKVAIEGASASEPLWSPDGRYVVFEVFTTEPVASTEQQEETELKTIQHAALHDTATGATDTLAENVGPPFLWKSDGSGFVALRTGEKTSDLVLFGLDGAEKYSVRLTEGIHSPRQLCWIPGEHDVAFVGTHAVEDLTWQDVYRTRGSEVEKMSDSGLVDGLGSSPASKLMAWMESSADPNGISLALRSYDPRSGSIGRLPFPNRPAFLRTSDATSAYVSLATFSPNLARIALIVSVASPEPQDGEHSHYQEFCYSIETNGSGVSLIRPGEVDRKGSLHPAWSQNGQRLLLLDTAGEEPKLLVYNADGTGKRMASLPKDETTTE